MDGMKPFPQSCSQKDFWPILGSFANQDEPFMIAVFYGDGKPNDLNAFLEDYVAEVAALQESGFEINGTVYPFRVRNYILDAPARAFIKCCVGHGGTFACESAVSQVVDMLLGKFSLTWMLILGLMNLIIPEKILNTTLVCHH